jgi:Domain of unknown function (DUF4062)
MKLNMHTSHPSAFISSTFIDLQEERAAVAIALRERGLNVNALDVKPASNGSTKDEILNGIKESDFLILLIGDRYGSILPSVTGNDSTSITRWEYQKAFSLGRPVIVYFKQNIGNDAKNHDDTSESLYKKKRILFERFKKLIMNRHNPAYFSDSFELAEKVQSSIIPTYRSGVRNLNLKNIEMANKIIELENEIKRLKKPGVISLPDTSPSLLQKSILSNLGKEKKNNFPTSYIKDLFSETAKNKLK